MDSGSAMPWWQRKWWLILGMTAAIAYAVFAQLRSISIPPVSINPFSPNDITTIVLTAGQSNAVGGSSSKMRDVSLIRKTRIKRARTRTEKELDQPNNKVFVWALNRATSKYEWMKAEVLKQDAQTWIYYAAGKKNPITNQEVNLWTPHTNGSVKNQSHGGFHIARHIVENTDEIVGIIPTGYNAMPIEFWWSDISLIGNPVGVQEHLENVIAKVDAALAALTQPDIHVDLIWWMQGEANTRALDPQRYMANLFGMINHLSTQPWFTPASPRMFIANHIYEAEITAADRANDADRQSRDASDFDKKNNQRLLNNTLDSLNAQPFGDDLFTCSNTTDTIDTVDYLHFDAPTLSNLGKSVADKFLGRVDCGGYVFDR